MKKVTFTYDLGTEVRIKAIKINGFIDGLCLADNGQQFRVIYWNKGDRHSVWMYEHEIEECPKDDVKS